MAKTATDGRRRRVPARQKRVATTGGPPRVLGRRGVASKASDAGKGRSRELCHAALRQRSSLVRDPRRREAGPPNEQREYESMRADPPLLRRAVRHPLGLDGATQDTGAQGRGPKEFCVSSTMEGGGGRAARPLGGRCGGEAEIEGERRSCEESD
jgi:hypothetical protein